MNDWITDRAPTMRDGNLVYRADGTLVHWSLLPDGEAWKPVAKIEPYVKPKRWVVQHPTLHCWRVRDTRTGLTLNLAMYTEEHARKFETFLNEVMP